MAAPERDIPAWMCRPEGYEPPRDRDGFITRSMLQLVSALRALRLDAGSPSRLSPSPSVRLVVTLLAVVLVSLASNLAFVAVMLALVLVRACVLPRKALRRVVTTSVAAASLALVVMLPATLLGQTRAAVSMALRTLVSCGLVTCMVQTMAPGGISSALRALRVPGVTILTLDLALRSIVDLGRVALEVLTALRLRSVGRNRDKGGSIGGVGGVLLLKASEASRDTYDAMRCRGFDGSYDAGGRRGRPRGADAPWVAGAALLLTLFSYLQAVV